MRLAVRAVSPMRPRRFIPVGVLFFSQSARANCSEHKDSARQMSYTAEAIEVLSGLDPVRKRPGMYTDTSRPNHLAQEVIDNSVDEALAGHARSVQVILHQDNSLEVIDDGRGMPVDIHPEEGVPGVDRKSVV